MNKLYKHLQNSFKNRPRFSFKYLVIECPAFISNLLLRNPHSPLFESRHWWDNYPKVDANKYDDSLQYFPRYE